MRGTKAKSGGAEACQVTESAPSVDAVRPGAHDGPLARCALYDAGLRPTRPCNTLERPKSGPGSQCQMRRSTVEVNAGDPICLGFAHLAVALTEFELELSHLTSLPMRFTAGLRGHQGASRTPGCRSHNAQQLCSHEYADGCRSRPGCGEGRGQTDDGVQCALPWN